MTSAAEQEHQLALPGLDLVRDFVEATEDGKSNTIELFDAIVTYSSEHSRSNDRFLKAVKTFKGSTYKVSVAPAAIERGEKSVQVLPGRRENLVEKALRKIASDNLGALDVTEDKSGAKDVWVKFTMYQLRKILGEQGHGFNAGQLEEALQVLTGTKITVTGENDEEIQGWSGSAILQEIVWRKRKKGDADGRDYRIRAKFHALVTNSIMQRTFRMIDFQRLMRPKSELARWLYTKISHNFTQAGEDDLIRFEMGEKNRGYHISLSTIIRENGLQYADLRLAVRAVRSALAVLREHDILRGQSWAGKEFTGYIEEATYAEKPGRGRPPLREVVWTLFPSEAVINDIIKANRSNRALAAKQVRR